MGTASRTHRPSHLAAALGGAFVDLGEPVHRGASWTTDAPFRETATAIERAHRAGVHAVEMEAAALSAYAQARHRDVVCVAHVTNTMATDGDDFEKGHDNGTEVEFVRNDDTIVVRKTDSAPSRGRQLVERLRGRGDVAMTTDEIMALTRDA